MGLAERLRQQLNEFRTGHTQQDVRGARRVDEGAQQIEQGADAQLPADGAYITEGRMKIRREQESEVPLVQQAPDILRSYVQREPQAFQSIRRTAGGGHGAVAVLHHSVSHSGQRQSRGRGAIERVAAVPARAYHVNAVTLQSFHPVGAAQGNAHGVGHFQRGFPFHAEPH